ncbi:unnamed protein product [Porites lobata]|uniref:G-protein coupled receptors family 1 profile domain-containing protein n=1 Tax=Porites lobata TaxID=104759 RepID=A0ABN8QSI9_9CNID|nr:unnamed protein product [Porites lobata]
MSWFYILGWFPSIVAVSGNALVVFLIASKPRLHTRPNWFITSLALADFAVGFIYFPTNFLCGERSLCKNEIAQDIAVLAIYSSITNLCAMTTDRYIAIKEPLRYVALMTSRRATIIIALAWLIPLILDYIPALCTRLGKCYLENKALVSTKMILFEILPCLFLLITTTQIITTATRHRRRNALLNSQLQYNKPNRQRTKGHAAAKVIVIVVVVFLSCYFVELYSVVGFLVFSSTPSKEVKDVISFFIPVNSAANPIAYALFKRDIRKELQKTYRKHPVPRPRSSASTAV